MEWFGSVIVPIITSLSGFPFGWAKPIEWNPYNIKNRRWGELLISLAGPAANILIALVFGFVIRFGIRSLPGTFLFISIYIVTINIALAVFNLIPIPPLDGSKILFSLLPQKLAHVRQFIERYSIFLVLILIVFIWPFVGPLIPFIFKVITGMKF